MSRATFHGLASFARGYIPSRGAEACSGRAHWLAGAAVLVVFLGIDNRHFMSIANDGKCRLRRLRVASVLLLRVRTAEGKGRINAELRTRGDRDLECFGEAGGESDFHAFFERSFRPAGTQALHSSTGSRRSPAATFHPEARKRARDGHILRIMRSCIRPRPVY